MRFFYHVITLIFAKRFRFFPVHMRKVQNRLAKIKSYDMIEKTHRFLADEFEYKLASLLMSLYKG